MSTSAWTLRGGTIIDGTGQPRRVGNVVIVGDRIASVDGDESQGTVIDAEGLVISPGFIDIHSHDDWIAPLKNGAALLGPNVQQGITTTAAGNCGLTPAPLAAATPGAVERMAIASVVTDQIGWNWQSLAMFFDHLEEHGLPLNLCMFVGHNTLRATVMGGAERPPSPGEMAAMQRLLDAGLRDGAVGLSIGLEYFPGRYAGPSELQALAGLLTPRDALFATHTRGISALFDLAMTEAITVAERAGCRLQIAHVNPMGPANWDAIDHLFERVEAARAGGMDIAYDIVGYVAWTLTVIEVLPHFVQDFGADAILALCASSDGRSQLRAMIETALPAWPAWIEERVTRNIILELGWDALVLADPASTEFEPHRGESLGWIGRLQGRDPYEVYFDLIVVSAGRAQIVNVGYGGNFEDDTPLRRLMERPDAIPETDTVPVRRASGEVYLNLPLFYGTMARFLGHFSRDLGLVRLEDAIHRITGLPAARLRLVDRGVLREGAYADITVFDPETVGDRGTYLEPQPAGGIPYVFVNGHPVVQAGTYQPDRLAGRVLRKAT